MEANGTLIMIRPGSSFRCEGTACDAEFPRCSPRTRESPALSSLRFQPAQVVRVALVEVFQLEQVVVEMAVELTAFGPIGDEAFDLHQPRASFALTDAVEARVEFGRE